MSKPSITSEFDPSNEAHVMWLKKTSESFKAAMKGEKVDFMKAANNHPFSRKSQIAAPDWPEIHFPVSVKYTDAIFEKKAFIPK
tara:strand:- start:77 stop:328 length:252 start_codon:yes stop_codon:yes gene_type:complete